MHQEKASRFSFVNPSALMHSEGYSSSSVCVCVCVCVSVFSILPSRTFWCPTRGRLSAAIAWEMQ